MILSILLHTNKAAHVLSMELQGTFKPHCQEFKILIGDNNQRDFPECRQATWDLVSCFQRSRSHNIAKERDLG